MIAVVSVHDKKYEPLAEWTLHKNKKEYCEKHGYILEYADDGGEKVSGKPMMLPPAPETHIPIGWGKIFLMKDVFRRHPDVEWIFNIRVERRPVVHHLARFEVGGIVGVPHEGRELVLGKVLVPVSHAPRLHLRGRYLDRAPLHCSSCGSHHGSTLCLSSPGLNSLSGGGSGMNT